MVMSLFNVPCGTPARVNGLGKSIARNVPLYEAQWQFLASLECQARWDAGLADTSIEIWENDSLTGGFDKLTDSNPADLITYTNLQWTRVQVLQATRTIRPGGGSVVYEQSIFEFVIDDDFYTSF
jgi:hypothetical protein